VIRRCAKFELSGTIYGFIVDHLVNSRTFSSRKNGGLVGEMSEWWLQFSQGSNHWILFTRIWLRQLGYSKHFSTTQIL